MTYQIGEVTFYAQAEQITFDYAAISNKRSHLRDYIKSYLPGRKNIFS